MPENKPEEIDGLVTAIETLIDAALPTKVRPIVAGMLHRFVLLLRHICHGPDPDDKKES